MSCDHVPDIDNSIAAERGIPEKVAPESLIHGGDVYRNRVELDYSVNLNPMTIPEAIMDAAYQGLRELHQYPDPLQQKLRESIAAYEVVSPDNVICGSGASELIMAVCHAFMPMKALITAPCYAGYRKALDAVSAEVTEYMLSESSGFELDEGFLGAITDETDIVFIADPNNPNGRLIGNDLRDRIEEECDRRGIILVIDECFLPLTKRGLEHNKASGRTLHLRAFTKTFAVPGIRMGYMISGDQGILTKIAKHLPEWNVSRIAERTGEAAAKTLKETDYLESSVSMIEEERAYLARELGRLGIRVYASDTNYLLLRSIPDLYERMLEHGILIRKCSNFTGLDETFFRIAVRTHEDNKRLIEALRDIL